MAQNLLTKLKRFFTMKPWRSNVYDFLTVISILAYGVVFSYFTILKHYNFSSYAADLGVFGQSLYTTLFNGRLFYYTIEQWLVPSGVFFGVHFSPILFLLLPIYAIYPSPESLLVAQSFLLAFAALPLYKLSAKLLKSKGAGFALVVVFLLYVPLQGANWFDFHPQAFIPLLVFAMYYAAINRSWKLYFLSIILALMTEEHMVYIVFLLAIYLLLKGRVGRLANSARNLNAFLKQLRRYLSQGTLRNMLGLSGDLTAISSSIWAFISCVVWFFLTRFVKGFYPVNPQFLDIYQAVGAFRELGFRGDLTYLPIYVLLNPQKAFGALMFDFPIKFLYLVILFGPLLFLSFRSKLSLITLVILGSMLLTNYQAYYTVGAQYPLYLAPLVFIATVEVLAGIHDRQPSGLNLGSPSNSHAAYLGSNHTLKSLLKNMIIVSLIFSVSTSPLSPIAYTFTEKGMFWYPSPTQFKQEGFVGPLHEMIALIPANASILTQNPIFPHVSSRIDAYLIPFDLPSFLEPGKIETIENYVRQIMNDSEYILLDSSAADHWTVFVREEVSKGQFGLYALAYSFILFKRNYGGVPIFVPDVNREVFQSCRDFAVQNGQIVFDQSSESKNVALARKGIDKGILIYGPYVCLPKGNINVTYEVKAQDLEKGQVCSLDVATNKGQTVLAEKALNDSEFKSEGWTNVTMTLSPFSLLSDVEFRVSSSGLANVYVDRIIVEKIG